MASKTRVAVRTRAMAAAVEQIRSVAFVAPPLHIMRSYPPRIPLKKTENKQTNKIHIFGHQNLRSPFLQSCTNTVSIPSLALVGLFVGSGIILAMHSFCWRLEVADDEHSCLAT
eukprot:gnl/MRDRNA2_/MRDRNA2_31430_c0_seq1.p1 gnl/MRDRNA2_/MRDRNA2_31430_c0~~gnl/MRDRNA2_/MRDRNA2_31430_c0_seq1.p1  ORF type:complete len:114 (-),score=19.33 gnl/MRDRNA2_/MRDRNA2_31430_c0_seq1:99-440(-)